MSRPRVIGLLLALVTLLAYLPATWNGFINYDDNVYITENPIVQKGLTWAGVKWAFTTWYASNWHPLTWLSHMVDCDLFRLNPGGHHLVSVLFHTANTVLLFTLLLRLTGSLWPCAFIAALFAWHPLHVQSVAWASERKDVLSVFFALLALLSYARFAGEKRRRSFWFALIFFALGLMSKPMLVTLPFVMVLLDYWPLQRTESFLRLILEKWPFFLLATISCMVTFLAQRAEAVASLAKVPLLLRFENGIISYADYLLKTIWPANLAIFYPLQKHPAWFLVMIAAMVLIFFSATAWLERKRSPWLLIGWLWFLGTLVPVIGLVQVGDQAMADRYSYFSLIGIFTAVAFLGNDLARRFQFLKPLFAVAAVLILTMCLILTERQLRYWRNSETLFTHALAVTADNALDHLNLGTALEDQNKLNEALIEYQKALRLDPNRHEIYNNIGRLLNDEGKHQEALGYCRQAVRLDPQSPSLHNSLGIVLAELGHFDEAMSQFSEAEQLDADYAPPQFQMGRTLLLQGRDAEAMPHFQEALRIDPDNFQMLIYIARVLAASENARVRNGMEALTLAKRADKLAGKAQPVVLDTLAMAYAETGHYDEAVQNERQAITLANANGGKADASMSKRLELYQNQRPWRDSFKNE